jgi:hypothetical protein
MRGLLPLLVGQTPSPENHAKLLFTTGIPKYPFLCAIYLDLVSCLMEPTGTGQVNATCQVGSTLS